MITRSFAPEVQVYTGSRHLAYEYRHYLSVASSEHRNWIFPVHRNLRHFTKLILSSFIQCWSFKQSVGAQNRVGIGLSYQAHQATQDGGIDSLESIFRLLKDYNSEVCIGRRSYLLIQQATCKHTVQCSVHSVYWIW